MQGYKAGLFGAAALVVGVLSAAAASAQSTSFVPLSQSVAPFKPGVQVLGEAAADATVHFQVALKLRDAETLTHSNARGRVLSPGQVEQRYLPTQADYNAVVSYLRASGLTIEATSPERLSVSVSGTAAQVARATGAHFSRIQYEGVEYTSADSAPKVPASIAAAVLGFNGLQPELHARKMGHISPISPNSATAAPYYPSAFLNAYTASGIANKGAGTTTAVVIDTFPNTSDLTKFWSTTGVAQSLNNITLIQAVSGHLARASGEETLDVETASSLAPSGKVRVYASVDLSFAHLDTAYQKVISDMRAGVKITQVSVSLGACETGVPTSQMATDDNYFSVMTSLGASVMVSSGDDGSHECGGTANTPSFFSTSPNVTAVGGTNLKINAGSSSPYTETGWTGSGGGVSTYFAKPSYQSGLSYAKRAVPDISADADPNTGALVVLNGRSYQYGGTSLAAPIWAGLMALVNADRAAAGKSPLGLVNSRVYPLLNTTNFRDVTSGNNGGYTNSPGYDLVTGIGSPLLNSLDPTLVGQN